MLWIQELGRRLIMMIRRGKLHRELEEEMRLHIDLRAEGFSERGVMHSEARAMAGRQFGNRTLLHEQSRDEWSWVWLDQLFVDVRLAARHLRSSPGFAALTVLSWKYFFAIPLGFSFVITVCLILAAWRSAKPLRS